jgi:hypothetical protein
MSAKTLALNMLGIHGHHSVKAGLAKSFITTHHHASQRRQSNARCGQNPEMGADCPKLQ